MIFKLFSTTLILLFFATAKTEASIVSWENCGTSEPASTDLADIDTIRAVVLFTAGDFFQNVPGIQEMRQWMYDIWNESYQTSLTHFYQTTSFGKFRMAGDSYPAGDTAFLTDLPWGSFWDFAQHHRYMDDILPRADSVIDFGLYDNGGPNGSPTPDGIVDTSFL